MKADIVCITEVKTNKLSVPYGVFFLALALFGVFLAAYPFYVHADMEQINYSVIAGILLAPFGLICFLANFYTSDFHFDLQNKRYRQVAGIGVLKTGSWKGIGAIEYISVFRQFYSDKEWENEKDIRIYFDVNLWYTDNRYVTLTSYGDCESAIKFGRKLAEGLNVRLLDSTVPNDFRWVELRQNHVKTPDF